MAAGVTPLEHTVLSGGLPRAKAPLVLGSEGAGVVVNDGDPEFPAGTRVMFAGPYGVSEKGSYAEWLAVRREHLCTIPDNIDDVSAAGLPVAYLTSNMSLSLAGFKPGQSVFAPAIGGSVGNAVTQLARAMGASHAISSTTSRAKAEQARAMGFEEVIDLSAERLQDGVRRITGGYGADIIIDAVGGELLGDALGTLAVSGSLTTLGYSAGRKSTIDVTDLIWKRPSIRTFRRGQADRGADLPAEARRRCASRSHRRASFWTRGAHALMRLRGRPRIAVSVPGGNEMSRWIQSVSFLVALIILAAANKTKPSS